MNAGIQRPAGVGSSLRMDTYGYYPFTFSAAISVERLLPPVEDKDP
jgi:hypothetical protein